MNKLILPLVFIFFNFKTFCQTGSDTGNKPNNFTTSYTIKWNPASLTFGKLGFLGEYNLKNKRSVTFGVGIPVKNTVGYDDDGVRRKLSTKTFSAMAGYRMYLGKGSIKGFYFEPYLEYVKNDWNSNILDELDNVPTVFATTSKYSGIGVGAQLGVQFMISNRVAIDFFFLGPEANISRHQLLVKDITSTTPWDSRDAAEAQVTIESIFRDEPIIGDKIKIQVDAASRTVTSDYKGFLPGFRAGVSFGVRI